MAERFGDALSKLGKETGFEAFRQEPWERGQPVFWDQMYETASTAYHRSYNGFIFGALVDPRRTGPPNAYSNISMMPGRSEESLRRYVERIGVPPAAVDEVVLGGTDGYDVPLLTRFAELYNVVLYAFGSCQRPFFARVLPIDVCAQLFSAATGIAVTAEDLLLKAERVITLQRLFNLRQGLTKADDMYPSGYLDKAQQDEFAPMVEKYYEAHGWDRETGVPRRETLAQLGLEERTGGALYHP
jgi:hypothetical protein